MTKVLLEVEIPDGHDVDGYLLGRIDPVLNYTRAPRHTTPGKSNVSFAMLREANLARREVWHALNTEQWGLVDWTNELAGETGEACDVVKKIRRVETGVTKRGPRTKGELYEALWKEIADVVIVADLVGAEAGFLLGVAVREKFNEVTRKHDLGVYL